MSKDRPGPSQRILRHLVLFSFKETATSRQIEAIEEAFCSLPGRIPWIQEFEWGTDVSVEGLSQGHTHCFLVTFGDEKERDAYLPHLAHQEFVALLEPHLEKALVVDYWARK